MKTTRLTKVKSLKVKPLKNALFWLLGIAAGLIAIISTLTWKSGDVAQVGMSGLYFLAVASLLGDKRHSLNLESNILPSILGGLLITLVLWQSMAFQDILYQKNHLSSLAVFMRVSPFISALGLGLIASGFKGLKQYWQELTILFFLGIPYTVLSSLFDISSLTAKFSAFLLWYSGFDVTLQGLYINLPTGSIEVYIGCSGIESICYLLGISVICLLMFPIEGKKRNIVPIVAVLMAFIINGIRVALLAVMAAKQNSQAFDYWHEGDGSLIFGMIAVLAFCFFYMFLLRQEENKKQNSAELEKS